MGLYNFRPQFEPFIRNWSKRHTIRGERAHPDRPGNAMHNYVGLRHPGARCLMRPVCVRVEGCRIEGGVRTTHRISVCALSSLDGEINNSAPYFQGKTRGFRAGGGLVRLAEDELQNLAWRDGFRPEGSTLEDPRDAFRLMMNFWTGRLPFVGTINHWNPAHQLVEQDCFGRMRLRWTRVEAPGTLCEVAHNEVGSATTIGAPALSYKSNDLGARLAQ